MKTAILLPASLVLGLLACGGGAGTSAVSQPSGPSWSVPVTVDERQTLTLGALVSDGSGVTALLWRRGVPDGSGAILLEQAGARQKSDGAWGSAEVLDPAEAGAAQGIPAAAVDAQGRGWMLWFTEYGSAGSASTELRGVPLDLRAATPWVPPQHQFIFPAGGYSGLKVAVGSDGTARAAWVFPGRSTGTSMDVPMVWTSRFGAAGVWESPVNPGGTAGAGMSLIGLVGDGLGGYALEQFRANDQPIGEAQSYLRGQGQESAVPGWEPPVQSALASHTTAWARDGQGGLEAWLVYDQASAPFREAWPRRRNAQGEWNVGGAVSLPRPAGTLAVFREPSDAGWLAGSGSEGLWVAPLSGVTPGTARLLVASPSLASGLVGVRDAQGRPALLWIQSRNGVVEGIGFTRLDAGAWTPPLLLPGTAGSAPQNLRASAGPGGLVAAWEQPGDRTFLLRTAVWR